MIGITGFRLIPSIIVNIDGNKKRKPSNQQLSPIKRKLFDDINSS